MSDKFSSKLIVFFLLLTIILSFWLYRSSFHAYFFQDDWFTFKISRVEKISDIVTFFLPRSDVIYYRPLGMQMPFFLMRFIFGINSLPFHILIFATHSVNIILVYLLATIVFKNRPLSVFLSFLYGTSSVFYIPFYWSATYAFILGPTFFFLSFIFFTLFFNKRIKKYYFCSLVFYLIGILINEIIIILPLILFFYLFLIKKRLEIKSLLSYVILLAAFFFLRFFLFKPPMTGWYQISIGRNIVTNFKTYMLWSFNWSEVMTEQMVHLFNFNANFFKEFSKYVIISLLTFFISFFIFIIIPLISFLFKKNKINWSVFLLGIFWFVIALLPVIFFVHHSFSYYLSIALIGLLISLITLLNPLLNKLAVKNLKMMFLLISILSINWILISKTTIDFNFLVHWAPRRARISENLTEKARKNTQFEKPLNNYIYVKPSSENKLALNDQDAFQIIFGENIVTVYGYSEKNGNL